MKILKNLRSEFNLTKPNLAKELNLTHDIINKYELNIINPNTQNLIAISNFFNFSLDFLINEGKTDYPKNLKLLNLGKEIDNKGSNERFQIESTAASLLNKVEVKDFNVILDNIDINLTGSFHENLKALRIKAELSQTELGKDYNISARMISGYEKDMTPPYDKLSYLAGKLGISVHALVTGEKLNFAFDDKHFGNTMLKADHFLPFEDQKVLIHLMNALV